MLNNNQLLPLVIILILGICFVSSNNKSSSNNKTSSKSSNDNLMICMLVIGIVLFFVIQDMKKSREGYLGFAPIEHRMNCGTRIRQPITNTPLVRDVTVHSPIGSPHILTEDLSSNNFPTVDGDKNSPRHLFMFANNQASPECCPSTYSTSTGCICRNTTQDKLIQSRGSNKSYNGYPDI
jgi:hypothetical protein